MRLLLGPPPPPVSVFEVVGEIETYLAISEGIARPTYQLTEPIPGFAVSGPAVAVLGGSSVHIGKGAVRTEEEFPALLQGRLGVPVHNLGAPGMDSFDLVRLTEELAAVSLDALVVYTGHNDLGNVLFQQRYGDLVGGLSARLLPGLQRLQLFSQLHRLLRPASGTAHPDQPDDIRRNEQLRPTAQQRAAAVRFFSANLDRIVWTCQKRDLPLVLVVPASDLLSPPARDGCAPGEPCAKRLWQRGTEALQAGRAEEGLQLLRQARDLDPVSIRASSGIEDAVRALSGERGVTVVDAAAQLPRMPRSPLPRRRLFEDAIHFSAQGHAALADLIEPPLRDILAP